MSRPELSRKGSADRTPLPTSRLHAARLLLKPHQVKESIAVAAQPSLRNATLAGLQSALTFAIALTSSMVSRLVLPNSPRTPREEGAPGWSINKLDPRLERRDSMDF